MALTIYIYGVSPNVHQFNNKELNFSFIHMGKLLLKHDKPFTLLLHTTCVQLRMTLIDATHMWISADG